jgi:uncharacterized PurR-regulated membrane protein YhhQ (DUF165 family)
MRQAPSDRHAFRSASVGRNADATGFAALAGYIVTIWLANYSLGHWGTICPPDGPCMVPVAPGLLAPSGVVWVGLALFLRDLIQDRLGRRWTVGGIVAGSAASYFLAGPALALASGVAFLLSEAADFVVYTPLRAAGRQPLAVLASGTIGALVDSAVFLWLAFGSLAFLAGQFLGKTEMTLLCAGLVWLWRRLNDPRRPLASCARPA